MCILFLICGTCFGEGNIRGGGGGRCPMASFPIGPFSDGVCYLGGCTTDTGVCTVVSYDHLHVF